MSRLDRFAYAVTQIDNLSPAVAGALSRQLLPGEAIQQMIFAPGHAIQPVRHPAGADLFGIPRSGGRWAISGSGRRQNPDWLLVLTDSRLVVVTSSPASPLPQVTTTPLVDIVWLELGTILLFSWIEWSWVSAGRLEQERVYFNTVSDALFWDIITAARRKINSQVDLPPPVTQRHLGIPTAMPFKFRNITTSKVFLPEDDVRTAVYQPPIWRQRFVVLRQKRTPGMIVVLSTTHLLVAYEDLSHSKASYGMVARYCPFDKLRKATLERVQDDLWLNVAVGLAETQVTLHILFEPAAETALQTLADRLNEIVSPATPVLERHGQVST